ncbi:MAG: IS1595 family transposase [Crocinitomicaceae bacterium]|nr:IS1595 family transposase [Crocinitomicaceae bacterium]
MKQFENILSQVKSFTNVEKRKFAKLILASVSLGDLYETRSEIIGEKSCCPNCDSEKVKKNGSHNGKQRYVCLECGKGYRDMTGTFAYRMQHATKLPRFIELMLESKSIREIALELKMGRQTVLDWRHKVLSAFNDSFTKEFMGIVETDDIPMVFNQKGRLSTSGTFLDEYRRTFTWTNQYGNRESRRMDADRNRKRGISDEKVSVLLCIDRYGTIGARKLRKGRITIESVRRVFDNEIFDRLNYGNVMVTDGSTAYRKVFRGKILGHQVLTTRKNQRVRGFYHLNTLNNADGQFKKWLKGNFSSVATKYLDNYLMYFKMIAFVLRSSEDPDNEFLRLALADNKAYSRMKSLEESYQEFLTYM